jgi:cholesterol oxidase
MKRIADVWDAGFRDNAIWHLGRRVITVHPLGGCSMGRDAQEGVVDVNGEVFGHPGLYVADGAVMPGPVGANPALTIAALADRFADSVVERSPTGMESTMCESRSRGGRSKARARGARGPRTAPQRSLRPRPGRVSGGDRGAAATGRVSRARQRAGGRGRRPVRAPAARRG